MEFSRHTIFFHLAPFSLKLRYFFFFNQRFNSLKNYLKIQVGLRKDLNPDPKPSSDCRLGPDFV